MVPYQLASLDGANGQLTAVNVATLDGLQKNIPADVLLPFFGLSMSLGPTSRVVPGNGGGWVCAHPIG